MNDEELIDNFWKGAQIARKLKEKQILDDLNLSKERVNKKDTVIQEMQFERKLLFNDFLRKLNDLGNSSFCLFPYLGDIMWNAWRWFNHKAEFETKLQKGEITQQEFDKIESDANYVMKTVKNAFFSKLSDQKKVKLVEMYSCWTVGYDFTYEYTTKDKNKVYIMIFVPNFTSHEDNYEYALNGYKAEYKIDKDDIGWEWITNNLSYEEVADTLYEWLENEKWKEAKENQDE